MNFMFSVFVFSLSKVPIDEVLGVYVTISLFIRFCYYICAVFFVLGLIWNVLILFNIFKNAYTNLLISLQPVTKVAGHFDLKMSKHQFQLSQLYMASGQRVLDLRNAL